MEVECGHDDLRKTTSQASERRGISDGLSSAICFASHVGRTAPRGRELEWLLGVACSLGTQTRPMGLVKYADQLGWCQGVQLIGSPDWQSQTGRVWGRANLVRALKMNPIHC